LYFERENLFRNKNWFLLIQGYSRFHRVHFFYSFILDVAEHWKACWNSGDCGIKELETCSSPVKSEDGFVSLLEGTGLFDALSMVAMPAASRSLESSSKDFELEKIVISSFIKESSLDQESAGAWYKT
jgi:hypothetical protein